MSSSYYTPAATSYNEEFVANNYRRSVLSNPQAHLERFGPDWNKEFRMLDDTKYTRTDVGYKVNRKRTLKSYRKNMCDVCYTIKTHTGACNCS